MLDSPTIRPARPSDIRRIVELWEEFMEFHRVRDAWYETRDGAWESMVDFVRDAIENARRVALVAEVGGRVVGYALGEMATRPPVFKVREYGAITDAAVTAEWRRKGVGGALVEEMVRRLAKLGARRIEVSAACCNEVSTRFWRKMRFKPTMERMFLEPNRTSYNSTPPRVQQDDASNTGVSSC
jgi:predicted N-acetyltransferase YhbS